MFRPGYDRPIGNYGRYTKAVGNAGELRFHQVRVANIVVNNLNGTIVNAGTLCVIPQGTGQEETLGRKVVLKAVNIRYSLINPAVAAAGATHASDAVRMIVYHDKQCNGTTATLVDILQAPVATGTPIATESYRYFNNLTNTGRFKTLVDRTVVLNKKTLALNGALASSNEEQVDGSIYKKVNIPIEYSGATGAITEIKSNNIGILLISEHGLGTFEAQVRLRFEG